MAVVVITVLILLLPVSTGNNMQDMIREGRKLLQGDNSCNGDSLQNPEEEHDLHVVIDSKQGSIITDDDGDGKHTVTLDGTASHTHLPGESIVYFVWTDENGEILEEGENSEIASATVSTGSHSWTLQIFDGQGKTLAACYAFTVASQSSVPGTLIKWYPALTFLEFDTTQAKYAQYSNKLSVDPPFPTTEKGVIEIKAMADVASGKYDFQVDGGNQYIVLVGDEQHVPGNSYTGLIQVSVRVKVLSNEDLPISVRMTGPVAEVTEFFHDDSDEAPIISSLTEDQGPASGGNQIKIFGNFINPKDATIFVGDSEVENVEQVTSQSIIFELPSGEPGITTIKVFSNGKISNELEYEYLSFQGPVSVIASGIEDQDLSSAKVFEYAPVSNNPFFTQSKIELPEKPTSLAWCHGKLYTSSAYSSTIQQIEFDENYKVVQLNQFNLKIGDKQSILGIGCNPKENGQNWKLYFTHTQLYFQSAELNEVQPYFGKVSFVTAPSFSSVETIVTGLPTSNYDHGVNQLQFGNDGNMFVAVGGSTNAGVANKKLGGLSESPYSATIVQFGEQGGHVTCEFGPDTPNYIIQNEDPMDARFGQYAECGGLNIYATGLRNAFGVLTGQDGELYITDNGPNAGFGACLNFDCGEGVTIPDRIVKVQKGAWYGHPNPTRGQNQFVPPYKPGSDGTGSQLIQLETGGTTGLCEYTSQTFRGQWFGHFFVQRYKGTQYRCDGDFSSCVGDGDEESRPKSLGTDCVVLPGGVVAVAQFPSDTLALNFPQDADAQEGIPLCFDVTPWRGIVGTLFHIGCANLQACHSELEVFFCSSKAEVSKVGNKWIEGVAPKEYGNCQIQVNCGGLQLPKINSFQFL